MTKTLLIAADDPPARMLLGSDAVGMVDEQLAAWQGERDNAKGARLSTDVTKGP